MKIRKVVTPAKADANKKNAQKSLGPTSFRGKDFSKRNSTRHGILSRDMLLPGESQTELEALRREQISYYCSVGYGEYLQVELMVGAEWRLRRLYRAEAGEITKLRADRKPAMEIASCFRTSQFPQAGADLVKLEQIEEEIHAEGRVSADNRDWLQALPYGEPARLFLSAIELIEGAERGEGEVPTPSAEIPAPAESGGGEATPSAEVPAPAESGEQPKTKNAVMPELRELLLENLNPLKEHIQGTHLLQLESAVSKFTAQDNALLIPQEAVFDRLSRYEERLLRTLYRAQLALERMQRLRLGEQVPPPSARVNRDPASGGDNPHA